MARRQCGQLDTPTIKEWVGSDQEGVGPLAREGCEDCIYLSGGAGIEDSDLQPENASSRFDVLRNGLGTRRISCENLEPPMSQLGQTEKNSL